MPVCGVYTMHDSCMSSPCPQGLEASTDHMAWPDEVRVGESIFCPGLWLLHGGRTASCRATHRMTLL